MRKYCPDPDHCNYSDCPTAFCDAKEPLVPAPGSIFFNTQHSTLNTQNIKTMNDIWTVKQGGSLAMVIDSGGNARGESMSVSAAQEIVDAHNRSDDHKAIKRFRHRALKFIQDELPKCIDMKDEPTNRNYWPMLLVLADGLTAQLRGAADGNLLSLKIDTEVEDFELAGGIDS